MESNITQQLSGKHFCAIFVEDDILLSTDDDTKYCELVTKSGAVVEGIQIIEIPNLMFHLDDQTYVAYVDLSVSDSKFRCITDSDNRHFVSMIKVKKLLDVKESSTFDFLIDMD